MSGTCSVRTENAGASMSISRSNAWRAEILVSGRLISEVGRGEAMSATVFIVERVLLQFLKSLRLTARGARAAARGQVPRGTTNQARCRAFARDRPMGSANGIDKAADAERPPPAPEIARLPLTRRGPCAVPDPDGSGAWHRPGLSS